MYIYIYIYIHMYYHYYYIYIYICIRRLLQQRQDLGRAQGDPDRAALVLREYLPYSTPLWNRFGAVLGCVCRLRRAIFVSQNWPKGQNMATIAGAPNGPRKPKAAGSGRALWLLVLLLLLSLLLLLLLLLLSLLLLSWLLTLLLFITTVKESRAGASYLLSCPRHELGCIKSVSRVEHWMISGQHAKDMFNKTTACSHEAQHLVNAWFMTGWRDCNGGTYHHRQTKQSNLLADTCLSFDVSIKGKEFTQTIKHGKTGPKRYKRLAKERGLEKKIESSVPSPTSWKMPCSTSSPQRKGSPSICRHCMKMLLYLSVCEWAYERCKDTINTISDSRWWLYSISTCPNGYRCHHASARVRHALYALMCVYNIHSTHVFQNNYYLKKTNQTCRF